VALVYEPPVPLQDIFIDEIGRPFMVEGIGWSTFRCWKPKFKEVYLVKCGHITFNNHYQCKGCMQRCL